MPLQGVCVFPVQSTWNLPHGCSGNNLLTCKHGSCEVRALICRHIPHNRRKWTKSYLWMGVFHHPHTKWNVVWAVKWGRESTEDDPHLGKASGSDCSENGPENWRPDYSWQLFEGVYSCFRMQYINYLFWPSFMITWVCRRSVLTGLWKCQLHFRSIAGFIFLGEFWTFMKQIQKFFP